MDERIVKELELLKTKYPDLQYKEEGRWILIPAYHLLRRVLKFFGRGI